MSASPSPKPIWPDHVDAAGRDDRIAERVKHAEIDACAMREQLLVQGDRVRLVPEQVEAQRLHAVRRKSQLGPGLRLLIRGLLFHSQRASHGKLEP